MRIPVSAIRVLSQPSVFRRYALAALLAGAATTTRYYLGPLLGNQTPFLFHAIAVCVSAQYGGIMPGIVTTILSLVTAYILFALPVRGPIPAPAEGAGLVLVLGVGIFLSVFFGRRRQAEEEVLRVYHNLETAQHIGNVGSWECDLVTNELWWSKETYQIFGLEVDTPVSRDDFFVYVHPEDRENIRELATTAVEGHQPYNVEHRIVRKSGEQRHVHQIAKVFHNEDHVPTLMIGCIQDITERKRAEQEIRVLRGLLPICANCKKIRDDQADGRWSEIETYVKRHSEASFTHSICPVCMEDLYGIHSGEDSLGRAT